MGLNQTRAVCPPDSLERSDAHSEWIALLADATEDASLVAQRVIAHVGAIQADWQHRISSRFRHIDGSERPDAWTSAHEGAQHLGMGCAQGIRTTPRPTFTRRLE